jgi:hypothetical protein
MAEPVREVRSAARKQSFEREGGYLYDRSEHARTMFDAPLFPRRRPKPRPSLTGFDLDQLLARVDTDDWDAMHTIIGRRSEPHVAEAVAAYASRTTVPTSAACHLLGTLGGPENRAALSRGLSALASSPMTFEKSTSCNGAAQRAASIAEAILKLDREAVEAADVVVHLFEHPTPYNRMWAVWKAANVYAESRSLRTVALERLAEGLRPMVRDPDPRVFIKAIPALVCLGETEWSETRRRCKKLLRDRDDWLRLDAVHLLLRCPAPDFTILADWFKSEPLIRLRVEFASYFGGLLSAHTIEALTREALADSAPSLRFQGIGLASNLDPNRQRAVIEEAVADEPDPELQAEMQRTLRHLGGG